MLLKKLPLERKDSILHNFVKPFFKVEHRKTYDLPRIWITANKKSRPRLPHIQLHPALPRRRPERLLLCP